MRKIRESKHDQTIEENETSVLWMGAFTKKAFCLNCETQLLPGDEDTRDNYCRRCGKLIKWVFPRGYGY